MLAFVAWLKRWYEKTGPETIDEARAQGIEKRNKHANTSLKYGHHIFCDLRPDLPKET